MYGCAAGVECGDAGGCDDGDLFVGEEGELFEERCFAGAGFSGEEDVSAGAIDELECGVHHGREFGCVGVHVRG